MTQDAESYAVTLLQLSRGDEQVLSHGVTEEIFGFHAQQAVEKAIKAVLTHREVKYPYTHNLSELQRLLARSGSELPETPLEPWKLTDFATIIRYEPVRSEEALDREAVRRTVAIILEFAHKTVADCQ
jgi:HEPN domain-containing protein